MSFAFKQKILFKHCDPAGIVFYPRYFEMINDCVEDFFYTELNMPIENMHQKNSIPAAQIECRFIKQSYHGDHLILTLNCTKLGRSSLKLVIQATCEDQKRFLAEITIVYVDHNGKPNPWPDALRKAIESHLVADNVAI